MSPILGIYASQISGHLWAPSGAYDSIATYTVGASVVDTITFSSIPSTYTHLQLRFIGHTDSSSEPFDGVRIRLNAVGGFSTYPQHYLYGNGASATAEGYDASTYNEFVFPYTLANDNPSVSSTFGVGVLDILDYSNTNKNKTVRMLSGIDKNGSGYVGLYSGAFLNTSAISTIRIMATGSYKQYSQFALYGIKGS